MSASEPLANLSQPHRELLHAYLRVKVRELAASEELRNKYPKSLSY